MKRLNPAARAVWFTIYPPIAVATGENLAVMARQNSIFSGSRFILKALVLTVLFSVLWVLANLGSLREYLDTTKARRAEQDKAEVLRQIGRASWRVTV